MHSLIKAIIIMLFFAVFSYADIIRVPDNYLSVQEAVDASSLGDTVLIASGEYEECVLIDEHDITLASEYILSFNPVLPYTTILSAPEHPASTEHWPTIDVRANLTVRIIGLTIQNGYEHEIDYYTYHGAGISINHSVVVIENCIIRDNDANSGGGIGADSSDITVKYCTIEENTAIHGAGMFICYSTILIEDNLFRNHDDDAIWVGGAITCFYSQGEISRNRFIDNHSAGGAGAVFVGGPDCGSWTMNENYFENNSSATGGAVTVNNETPYFAAERNYFTGNASIEDGCFGGALDIGAQCDTVLLNQNLFLGNEAVLNGAAIFICSDARIENNIFIRNIASNGAVFCTTAGQEFTLDFCSNLVMQNQRLDTTEYKAVLSPEYENTITCVGNDFYDNIGRVATISHRGPGSWTAEDNYWGHSNGPYNPATNADGRGDTLHPAVDCIPFATQPCTDLYTPTQDVQDDTLRFKSVPCGENSERFVSIINRGVQVLEIESVSVQGLYFEADENSWAGNTAEVFDTLRIGILFAPDTQGNQAGSLTIITNDPDADAATVYMVGEAIAGDVKDNPMAQPHEFKLHPAMPNPFNSTAIIRFQIPYSCTVTITMVDILGRQVKSLTSRQYDGGLHAISVDAHSLASGVYFVRAQFDDRVSRVQKLVLLR